MLLAIHIDYQKAVAIVVCQGSVLNRAGKLETLFQTAVSDLHLLVGVTFSIESIAPAASNYQVRVVEAYLQIVRTNAGQIHLHEPTPGRLVNIRCGIPEASGWSNLVAYRHHGKRAVWVSHVNSISEN